MKAIVQTEFGGPEVMRVEEVFDLERAADAHRHAEDGHGAGKIVLRVP